MSIQYHSNADLNTALADEQVLTELRTNLNLSNTNSGDNATNSQYSGLATSKQDTLVSASNIKSINSTSLLGSGDLVITGSISDGDKGDIVVSSSGATWTIDDKAVTLAKQADMATASLVYRKTAGNGAPEVQTLATLKTDLGLPSSATGTDNLVLSTSPTVTTPKITGTLTLDKANTAGIKVDTTTPTYGWRDIIGDITPRASGGTAPALTAFRGGNILSYAYQANDWIDQMVFHMPHDYVQGTDIFFHIHWGHNGTAASGNFIVEAYATYCKGFNQAGNIFGAEITTTLTEAVTSIATHPRWSHNIVEVQLSNNNGDGSHLNTNALEVDGLVLISCKVTTIPTITGSAASNLPYIFTADIHYQSTNIATKQKAYPFWT